ncbi:MAG: FAD-dependent oxidoreductase [Chloroflexota bacterium]
MNEFVETLLDLEWHEQKSSYDVVIIGAGGHGLATAYYLATRHGISNVAVVEAGYIGSGNSGRNTTIIRANYGIAESVRFYQHSVDLYATLEEETGCWIMHSTKGLIWLAHTEMSMRAERARSLMNQACGAETVMITPEEAKRLCPQLDLTGGGRYPVLGASYHPGAATARHDRVVWAYAQGAMRRGVDILPHTPVTGLLRDGDRVMGVETPNGPISAGLVVSAVGGNVTTIAAMAGVRLPIRTHPLQALVTNAYAQGFGPIVSDSELLCYVSQTARGQMLMGAEFDSQPSYSMQSSFEFLQSVASKVTHLLPFLRDLRVLRQWTGICDISPDYSPIMGETGVDGFLITTGWGTWGFKAIPAGGEGMAEMIATGVAPPLIAPFALDRFARDHTMADQGSAGTR